MKSWHFLIASLMLCSCATERLALNEMACVAYVQKNPPFNMAAFKSEKPTYSNESWNGTDLQHSTDQEILITWETGSSEENNELDQKFSTSDWLKFDVEVTKATANPPGPYLHVSYKGPSTFNKSKWYRDSVALNGVPDWLAFRDHATSLDSNEKFIVEMISKCMNAQAPIKTNPK